MFTMLTQGQQERTDGEEELPSVKTRRIITCQRCLTPVIVALTNMGTVLRYDTQPVPPAAEPWGWIIAPYRIGGIAVLMPISAAHPFHRRLTTEVWRLHQCAKAEAGAA